MDDTKDFSGKKLTIIIPAYNEAENITKVIAKVCDVELPYGINKEVIVVDDGSKDHTAANVKEYLSSGKGLPVTLLQHETNHGKGRAIRTALQQATGDYVIIQDGDLELNPNDIAKLMKAMIDGNYDAVYGSRFLDKQNKSLYRSFYLGGRLVSHITNLLYGQNITDEPTCYKLVRAEVLKRFTLRCEGFEFCPEVTAKISKLGIKIHEEPIHYSPRTMEQGKKLRWTDGIEAVWTLIKYRFTN